jgi:hypothetical protein
MVLSPRGKRWIAGLTVASLMFQAALVAAQLSIVIAAQADAAAIRPTGIICTDHGPAAAPPDEKPADTPSTCSFCPTCLTSGAGQIAILPAADFSRVEVRARDVTFHFNADRTTGEHLTQPCSRGPPATA